MKVSILLATYNGEKYVREQIDSILKQTYQDFVLYISDDKSYDDTMCIINEYKEKYPVKIQILEHDSSTGSAKGNFLYLLKNVESDVFLFCDQDDVWTPDHIEILVNRYKLLSSEEKKLPVLIHTDLIVVNEKLDVIAPSFLHYAKIPQEPNKHFYYLSNNVTGCVSLINNSLKEMVFSDYYKLNDNIDNIIMHDHLFALISVLFGKKIYINKPTNLYRQHGLNEVGAGSGYNLFDNIRKATFIKKQKNAIEQSKRMMNFILDYFSSLDSVEKNIMYEFVNISNKKKIERVLFLLENKIIKYGLCRNLFLFFII